MNTIRISIAASARNPGLQLPPLWFMIACVIGGITTPPKLTPTVAIPSALPVLYGKYLATVELVTMSPMFKCAIGKRTP